MHTTVTTHLTNSIHGHKCTTTPSVHVILEYKCTLVHITSDQ